MQLSVVSSPCDNIIHSLVNTSDYSGSFLPGYAMTDDDSAGEEEEDLLADIDHVTYVCREGESLKILAFYKVGTAFPVIYFKFNFFQCSLLRWHQLDFGHY